jgi:hypothetical protein
MSADEYKRAQNHLVLDPAAPPRDGTNWDAAHDDYSVYSYYVEYPIP